ncbi:hypothetical protein BON30_23685 [Cystobacter ferrugineus]|uniref:Uncharacterized protein n=2 Tax=Cystobacter ferrugineus TaxID=83449 RepID=A0A1L9B7C4_9BACT|nr:hypothetical protein BON30_23685 [Cystobacter ferrugineus]
MERQRALAKPTRPIAVRLLLVLSLLVLGALGYALLSDTGSRPGHVLARATSAHGEYEAELIELNGGATDAYGYEVILSAPGRLLARKEVPFRSYMEPVPTAIHFTDNHTLEIILEEGSTLTVTIDEKTFAVDRRFRFHRGELQGE